MPIQRTTIEFGNRLLTFVLIIIALLTFIVVRRATRSERFGLTWPALALGLGIIAQALLGGVTVLTGLNPWIVGAHFLVSGILISIAAVLVFRIYSPRHKPIAYGSVVLAWPIFFIGWIAVLIGILVTGAGPHSGDANTGRNGLDLEIWQHYHSYPAYLMTALILISLFLAIRSTGLNSPVNKATLSLLLLFAISLVQALIGIIQSRLGVPPLLAAAHMLGASLIIAGLTFQLLTLRSKFQRVR
ncbi:MAG: COX15/CtaA family protein [Actinomycetota bacterium]